MLLEQDWFSKVSELSPCLVFATGSVSELFKLDYLNPLTFFHFVIPSDWLILSLTITFFFRIVEEEIYIYIYVQTYDTILTEKLFLL